jgi:hypothetical protein
VRLSAAAAQMEEVRTRVTVAANDRTFPMNIPGGLYLLDLK